MGLFCGIMQHVKWTHTVWFYLTENKKKKNLLKDILPMVVQKAFPEGTEEE